MKIRVIINQLSKKKLDLVEFELSERKRKVHPYVHTTEVVASWQRRKRSAWNFIAGSNKSNEIPLSGGVFH